MSNKDIYREFANKNSLPIFFMPWWLDTVAGDNWDVVIYNHKGKIMGVFPYGFERKIYGNLIYNPIFSNRLGPLIFFDPTQKGNRRLSFEKKAYHELIDQLPKFFILKMGFYYNFQNWLPFYWKGFSQTTMYSYEIDVESNFYENLSSPKKRYYRKAEIETEIDEDLDASLFYDLHKKFLAKRGKKIHFGKEVFVNTVNKSCEMGHGKIFYATKNGVIVSIIFFVWDRERAYYLIGSLNPEVKGSSFLTLLIDKAIKFLKGKTKIFDLEGSMIENVEENCRNLGGRQISYHSICKYNGIAKLKLLRR
ncbi:MAG: methicillin resistance protein [Candidatus Cloacimonadota bacterium]|nr:MAG: methicillin resistance protein [Candidatus Cloacimonadota bacterium]PIE81109.1 MAG: methicillin resistance protein [Candidatus Delongbacteria bacterium]